MNYIEDISSDFNIGTLNDIVESKNYEIKNSDIWIEYN